MKLLAKFDAENYGSDWWTFFREAVRAIIVKDGKIALVRSEKEGYYKFPGGGIEPNESHVQALIREVQEETGLRVKLDSVREFGMVHEIRKGGKPRERFEQKSYYYCAEVEDKVFNQDLDAYEAELGYTLAWTDVRTAYEVNMEIGSANDIPFVLREAYVMGLLSERDL